MSHIIHMFTKTRLRIFGSVNIINVYARNSERAEKRQRKTIQKLDQMMASRHVFEILYSVHVCREHYVKLLNSFKVQSGCDRLCKRISRRLHRALRLFARVMKIIIISV